MKGTPHEVFAYDDGVGICNVQDDHYWCGFQTADEVNDFIGQLTAARDQKWPVHAQALKD